MRRFPQRTLILFALLALLPLSGGVRAEQQEASGTVIDSLEMAQARNALMDSLRLDKAFGSNLYENAFRTVPRHLFLSSSMQRLAYQDIPLPGPGPEQSTIPSPSTLALILRYLRPSAAAKVLVAGSSAGYAAALLSRLCAQVYLIEWFRYSDTEIGVMTALGFRNVSIVSAKDFGAYSEAGPFDIILVHGSVTEIPRSLMDQLSPSGRLVASLRDKTGMQMVVYVERFAESVSIQSLGPSLIYPLVF
jgi:protein-L-isoaspartate(D-aspartate) O-methyltransferase